MKKMLKAVAAASALSAMGLGATAANAADATATATAEILEAVAIVNVGGQALDFGSIVPDATGSGTVVVAPSTATTPSSCTTVTCYGAVSSAPFEVTGTDGATVAVSVPASVLLTITGGGTDTMTASLSDNLGGTTATLSGGSHQFYVGGSLTVGAAQAAGVYNGTFTVSADYQ